MADFSTSQRESLAEKKQAMPDGSFPIRNRSDLKNAIQSWGRAKDKEAAKRWIKKRAKELNAEDLLPESWNELKHYGVKGMKWGIRHDYRKDKSRRRTLTRHVSADVNNIRQKNRDIATSRDEYNTAGFEYQKANSKVFISPKKKRALVKETGDKLTEAGLKLESDEAAYQRAKKQYETDAKKLRDHVDSMTKKYQDKKIKDLSEKTIKLGQGEVMKVINTGITVADLPFIGNYYTGSYTSARDVDERRRRVQESARYGY